MSDSLQPHGLYPSRLLCPWGFSRQEYWSRLPCHPPGGLPNPGTKPSSLTLKGDSLPFEPPEKPKSTGVGNLSLFQRIFQPQEPNQGLLHWQQILYQLSYQGSPQFSHILLVISHSLRLVFHIHIPQSPASSPHCPISPHSSDINLVFVSWTHGKYFTSVFYLLFLTHNALSQKNYMTTGTNILSQMLPLPVEDLP